MKLLDKLKITEKIGRIKYLKSLIKNAFLIALCLWILWMCAISYGLSGGYKNDITARIIFIVISCLFAFFILTLLWRVLVSTFCRLNDMGFTFVRYLILIAVLSFAFMLLMSGVAIVGLIIYALFFASLFIIKGKPATKIAPTSTHTAQKHKAVVWDYVIISSILLFFLFICPATIFVILLIPLLWLLLKSKKSKKIRRKNELH